jgi:cholesterol oxidase
MRRRNFLKTSSLAGVAIITGCKKENVHTNSERISTPNLVIGSGFGGSVTAYRLAQSGHKNVLIERGRSWAAHDFCSFTKINKKSTWLKKEAFIPLVNIKIPVEKYLGVMEYHNFPNMNFFNAAGVGGGSLVFGASFVRPDKTVFERVFPSDINFDEMDTKYYTKVEQEINVSHIPDDIYDSQYYEFARSFKDQVVNAGLTTRRLPASYDWNIVRQELNGEIPLEFLKGDGMFGTRNGCKDSLDKNYIVNAIATGNTMLYSQTNVVNIQYTSDKKYEVITEQLSEFGEVLGSKTFVTDKLFICAGTPNTIKLLLKAKSTSNLIALNNQIGKGFGTNGKSFFRRTIKESSGTYTGWTPAEASEYFDNPHVPVMVENIPQPLGLLLPFLPDLYSNFHAALGATTYRGSITYDEAKDDIYLDWDKSGVDETVAAAKHWAERVNAANPGSYVDSLILKGQYATNVSYHPLGGCVMGQATDMYGRIQEYPNLYVNDGTLIPGVCACSNPAFTIAALAERNIDKILQEDFA